MKSLLLITSLFFFNFAYSQSNTFQKSLSQNGPPIKVIKCKDGGYLVLADSYTTNNNIKLIKLDSNFDSVWVKTYGGPSSDHGSSIHQTKDNGFIICGSTQSFGPSGINVYLLKID